MAVVIDDVLPFDAVKAVEAAVSRGPRVVQADLRPGGGHGQSRMPSGAGTNVSRRLFHWHVAGSGQASGWTVVARCGRRLGRCPWAGIAIGARPRRCGSSGTVASSRAAPLKPKPGASPCDEIACSRSARPNGIVFVR